MSMGDIKYCRTAEKMELGPSEGQYCIKMKKLKQFIIQMLIHQEAAERMPKTKRNKKVNDSKSL